MVNDKMITALRGWAIRINSNIENIEKKMSELSKQLSDTDVVEIHDKFLDAKKGLDILFVDPMAVA
jgi:hypothetical protein